MTDKHKVWAHTSVDIVVALIVGGLMFTDQVSTEVGIAVLVALAGLWGVKARAQVPPSGAVLGLSEMVLESLKRTKGL